MGIFLFTTASRPALGPTQPPIQYVPGALSLGVKRPGREVDHLPPSNDEIKNAWSYTSIFPEHVFTGWCIIKHIDFTFIHYWTSWTVCSSALPSPLDVWEICPEAKGHKTTDTSHEIQETLNRLQFIILYKKRRHFRRASRKSSGKEISTV